jgi:hypothetical protein
LQRSAGGLFHLLFFCCVAPIYAASEAHKKGEYLDDLAFDTGTAHAYISRPRRPRRYLLRPVLLLWHDEISRRAALFDIVIRGRGTWAAVRSQPG